LSCVILFFIMAPVFRRFSPPEIIILPMLYWSLSRAVHAKVTADRVAGQNVIMSQDEQDRPSVLRAARERTRAEIARQILDAARRHLATEGAAGLSLRALAR